MTLNELSFVTSELILKNVPFVIFLGFFGHHLYCQRTLCRAQRSKNSGLPKRLKRIEVVLYVVASRKYVQ